MATEVLFYHLERQPLDKVLPTLVEKSIERGWNVAIQAGSDERVAALDSLLWTYTNESFLPHGTRSDGDPARQPIYLTSSDDNPNGAQVRFLVDAAALSAFVGYERVVVMFNGLDADAVAAARDQWRVAKAGGCTATYWQQSAEGRWTKKA